LAVKLAVSEARSPGLWCPGSVYGRGADVQDWCLLTTQIFHRLSPETDARRGGTTCCIWGVVVSIAYTDIAS
jgi:hypothetical protein